MSSNIIVDRIASERIKDDKMAKFSVGDNVKVHVKISEGGKERVQVFAGTVISRKGKGGTESFTVRRVSHGVGVERVFPIHCPGVAKIEVESSGRTRRAKLYFVRHQGEKEARLKPVEESKPRGG
jgi:large subunit ribosomal protein L19